jgi:hypothetical protein
MDHFANGMILWALVLILQEQELVAHANALPSYYTLMLPPLFEGTAQDSACFIDIVEKKIQDYDSGRS